MHQLEIIMARTAAFKDPITGQPLVIKDIDAQLARDAGVSDKVAKAVATAKAFKAGRKVTAKVAASAAAPAPAKAPKASGKAFVPPKNLALCADMYYQKREQRLLVEKQAAVLQAEESACREYLINNIPKTEASGIAGKVCRVAVENKEVVQVTDWEGVWGYIVKNIKKSPGVVGMVQRRINEAMVKEIWAAGKTVPGTAKLDVPVLRVNKL